LSEDGSAGVLFDGAPASLANSVGIFFGPKSHFDLVRAGAAVYGVSPAPGLSNPMLPVMELRARIGLVRSPEPGETIADNIGWTAGRRTRVALVSVGYADDYPRLLSASDNKLQVMVGGHRCPVAGHSSMDLLPIDVTDLPDRTAARYGKMATLIA
jgi:alanine racemase